MHANPKLDAVYENAKMYAWYCDAEAMHLKRLSEGGSDANHAGEFDWGVEGDEDDGEANKWDGGLSAQPEDDEEGFWLGQNTDKKDDEGEEEESWRQCNERRREQEEEEKDEHCRHHEGQRKQDDEVEHRCHWEEQKGKEKDHRLREEQKAREEEQRLREERKAKEEEQRLQEVQRTKVEAHRFREEQKAEEEERRLHDQQRARKEEQRLRQEQREKEGEECCQREEQAENEKGVEQRGSGEGDVEDEQDDTAVEEKHFKGKGRQVVDQDTSTSMAEEIWMAANIDLLQKAGKCLTRLMDSTGLPLYLILKKLDMAVVYSRENSYNLFKRFIKETRDSPGPVASFEDYNGVTSTQYNRIKKRCLTEGIKAWNHQKQEWKDVLIRQGDELQAPDRESVEVAGYMNKVIAQQEDLARKIRNNGPVEVVLLVYTLETGARGMSQFVTANPDLDIVIKNAPLDTRQFIERILHTVGMFEVGLLDPATVTWKDFQEAVIGELVSAEVAAPIRKGGKNAKPDTPAPAGVDAIADFRGWPDRICKDENDIPPEIKGIEREDRVKCHVILRGLFADKLNKAKPSQTIWRHNFNNRLVTHKLVFFIPGDFLPVPGTVDWDPNDWTKIQAKAFLDVYTWNESLVRMERWSDENVALALSDTRRDTIPIVISSTAPRHTIKNVGHTLNAQFNKVYKVNAAMLGTDKPLEVVHKQSELKRDLAGLHKAPTVKLKATGTVKHVQDKEEEEDDD